MSRFTYGNQIKFLATNTETNETRQFVLKRSSGATSDGYKLYGYQPEENKLNLLEDFGMDSGHVTLADATTEGKNRINFYCPSDVWNISRHSSDL